MFIKRWDNICIVLQSSRAEKGDALVSKYLKRYFSIQVLFKIYLETTIFHAH